MHEPDMLGPAESLEDVAHNAARDRAIANCKKKLPFRSRASARNWIILRQGKSNHSITYLRNLKIYQCPICSKWHLATKKK
jgi:hypothetical protein